jgi:hypothetical protein
VPAHAKPRIALYRIAQACWIVPLVIGLGVTGFYVLTRELAFAVVGLITILGGIALLGIGAVCLGMFWYLLRRCAPDARRTWSRRTIRLALLLAANVPIAIGCAYAGTWLMSRFPVTVINDAAVDLHDVTINVPGDSTVIPSLPAKSRITRNLTVRTDGDLTFSAVRNGQTVKGEAGGYLTTGPTSQRGTVHITDTTESASVR